MHIWGHDNLQMTHHDVDVVSAIYGYIEKSKNDPHSSINYIGLHGFEYDATYTYRFNDVPVYTVILKNRNDNGYYPIFLVNRNSTEETIENLVLRWIRPDERIRRASIDDIRSAFIQINHFDIIDIENYNCMTKWEAEREIYDYIINEKVYDGISYVEEPALKKSPFTQIEEKVTLVNPFTELETVNDYQKALQCVCRV